MYLHAGPASEIRFGRRRPNRLHAINPSIVRRSHRFTNEIIVLLRQFHDRYSTTGSGLLV